MSASFYRRVERLEDVACALCSPARRLKGFDETTGRGERMRAVGEEAARFYRLGHDFTGTPHERVRWRLCALHHFLALGDDARRTDEPVQLGTCPVCLESKSALWRPLTDHARTVFKERWSERRRRDRGLPVKNSWKENPSCCGECYGFAYKVKPAVPTEHNPVMKADGSLVLESSNAAAGLMPAATQEPNVVATPSSSSQTASATKARAHPVLLEPQVATPSLSPPPRAPVATHEEANAQRTSRMTDVPTSPPPPPPPLPPPRPASAEAEPQRTPPKGAPASRVDVPTSPPPPPPPPRPRPRPTSAEAEPQRTPPKGAPASRLPPRSFDTPETGPLSPLLTRDPAKQGACTPSPPPRPHFDFFSNDDAASPATPPSLPLRARATETFDDSAMAPHRRPRGREAKAAHWKLELEAVKADAQLEAAVARFREKGQALLSALEHFAALSGAV